MKRGFTILELLLVIAIITVLAVVLLPNIFKGKLEADRNATKAEIGKIKAMLEQYKTRWGDYPPSAIAGFTDANNLNQGIETLVACLASTAKGQPLMEWQEKRYTNFDNDVTSKTDPGWLFGDSNLREIVDLWRFPFVYFHSRDYDNPSQYSNYRKRDSDSDDAQFSATPQRSSATSTFHNPYEYQLWSIGPDGENQNGTGDDIPNW